MTYGTIAGILLTDIINGKKNDWEKLFDPRRGNIFSTAKVFLKEMADGTVAFFKDRTHKGKPIELTKVAVNEGKVIDVEGEKFAAYRDENSKLHVHSAKCTHLGCTVKWNNDEKSWDCPCHGSRYTYDGKVINGPANKDLSSYKPVPESKTIEHDIIQDE